MASTAPSPDLNDVQGEIFNPYSHNVGEHLLLAFAEPAGARAFVAAVAPRISKAADWNSDAAVSMNIGFTFAGLVAMGLPDAQLLSFPYAFRVGMAHRAPVLGDNGPSAPDKWDGTWQGRAIHAWLMVQADTTEQRDHTVAELHTLAEANGVTVHGSQQTANFTGAHARAKEHFGFMDGIGEPAVAGAPGPKYPGQGAPLPPTPDNPTPWGDIKLGSFLLGYENEFGETLPFPDPALRQNGTFMAFRKLEQHVGVFRDYIEANKDLVGGDKELLAAKMVGRWRSGAPLALSPDHDDPALADDPERNNNFRYADDPDGLKVPHLAHIRRVNPRDGLPEDSVVKARQHRIIRRSMPYGPWLPEGDPDPGGLGLVFRVYNADLLTQFELVQAQWVNSGNVSGGMSTDQDPIAGLTEPVNFSDGGGKASLQSRLPIPGKDRCPVLYGLPRFVTLKGGDYFFVPGLKALHLLCQDPANTEEPA